MAGKSAVVRVAIVSDNSKLTKGLADSQSKLKSFAKSIAKVGIAAGVAAGAGLALFAKSAVDAASDAQQSLGATETVFGKFADTVVKTSDRAAEAFGLSANEYRENANLIGSLLKNQGVSVDQLAGKTKQIVGVGADLAATFGGTTKDAVESLGAALKGEFDSLEKYGVSLKQSTVNQEAFRVAGVDSQKAFNKLSTAQQTAAKRQATTNLILKQSKDSMGAFARESDTLAHKQQVLSAQFDNVKAKIGNALLPVVTAFVGYLSKNFIPKLEELGDWLNDNQDQIAAWGDKLGDVAADAGELGETIAKTLYPPLKSLGELLADVVKWFNGLPDPIKKVGVEAGLAALLIWKLSPAFNAAKTSAQLASAQVKQFGAEMTYAETRSAAFKGGLAKLGGAAKAAAGVGGLVALSSGASQTNDGLKTLMDTAGGAATGFAVAGPWGAAIGGAAGLLWSLKDSFKDTEQAAREAARAAEKTSSWDVAKEAVRELTDALHGTVQAYSDVTAAAVQKGFSNDKGLLPWVKNLQDAGVSMDTLTRAVLGQKAAQALLEQAQGKVNANLGARKQAVDAAKKAYDDYAASVESHAAKTGAGGPTADQTAKMHELRDALKSTQNQYDDYKTSVDAGNKSLEKLGATTAAQNALEKTRRTSLGLTKAAYDAMPKEVRTKLEVEGAPQTQRSVIDFIRTAKLVPKEIVSVLKATGTTLSKAQAKALKIEYDKLPKEVTTEGKFKAGTSREDARSYGSGVGSSFGSGYVEGIEKWLGPAKYAAQNLVNQTAAAARHAQQSQSPSKVMIKEGENFGEGYARGIAKTKPVVEKAGTSLAQIAIAAFGSVQASIASMYRTSYQSLLDLAAAIRNIDFGAPARDIGAIETRVNEQLQGVTNSVTAWQNTTNAKQVGVYKKGLKARQTVLEAAQKKERQALRKTTKPAKLKDAMAALVKKQLKAKKKDGLTDDQINNKAVAHGKTLAAAATKARASLRKQYEALRKNAQQQDALATGNYLPYLVKGTKLAAQFAEAQKYADFPIENLEDATQLYDQLVQQAKDYAAAIKESFVNFGNVTGLGRFSALAEDEVEKLKQILSPEEFARIAQTAGSVSSDLLIRQLSDRVNQAKQFALDIKNLQGMGLDKAQIDQLLAAGPEAAADTAAALVAGGVGAVQEINSLSQQLAAAGGDLGQTLSDTYFDAGKQAALGLVNGLEAEQSRLNKAAEQMADALAAAVKKALKIHSPSQVMAGLGSMAAQGLAIGVDNTYARTAGAGLASTLVSSFGNPQLKASAVTGTPGGDKTQIQITLTAQQLSSLERGRAVQADLDAYRSAGGRSRA